MKVIVKKKYLKYAIGEEIEVRPQDAALLIPRGVVALPGEPDEGADEEITVKKSAPKRGKK
jgi:hypothetical protein